MQRFYRAMSVTLLVLASLILVVEILRAKGFYPRVVLAGVLTLFCIVVLRLSRALLSTSNAA